MSTSSFEQTASERLLQEFQDEKHNIYRSTTKTQNKGHIAYLITIFCLVASNLALIFSRQWQTPPADSSSHQREQAPLGRSQFAGLSYNTPVVYTNHSDYLSADETVASKTWTDINTSPIVVALTDEYADAHNIERSSLRFVWDESKGVYFIKLFHNLHCLKAMRKVYTDLLEGKTSEHAQYHFNHCLDSLRQDLLCQADDTPMPLVQFPDGVGYGQTRMCRNLDDLVSWTQEIERNACYHRFSDIKGAKHKIEMYAFCPKDSPYYEVSQAYFNKWGHMDPFDGDEDH